MQSRLTTTASRLSRVILQSPMEGSLRARLHTNKPLHCLGSPPPGEAGQHRAKFLHTLCQMQWTRFFKLQQAQVNTPITHHYSRWKSNMWTVIRRLILIVHYLSVSAQRSGDRLLVQTVSPPSPESDALVKALKTREPATYQNCIWIEPLSLKTVGRRWYQTAAHCQLQVHGGWNNLQRYHPNFALQPS